MKVGITGFPASGKTTIFQSLAPGSAARGRGPTLGNIKVHDPRVDVLAEIHRPRKTTYAEVTFVDVPGGGDPSSGALTAEVINDMRNVDVLVHVVRVFEHPFTGAAPDPDGDRAAYDAELVLADMAVIEKRLQRLRKEGRKDIEVRTLQRCAELLDAETPLRRATFTAEETTILRTYAFLSAKPVMTLFNLDEDAWADPALSHLRHPPPAGDERVAALGLCGQMEAEVARLPADEQAEFLEAYGLGEPARHQFVRGAYALLDLISFLTHGPDECRAWPIRRGTPAVRAAGKVHSDIERGFIRAEVMAFDDFAELRSEAAVKKAGRFRVEGRDYLVQDGDIINFLFNV